MSYLVVVTYDLENATSKDYANVKSELKKLELYDTTEKIRGNATTHLPNTTVAGQFEGLTEAAVRDAIREKVVAAMNSCNVTGKLFITVSDKWTWGVKQF